MRSGAGDDDDDGPPWGAGRWRWRWRRRGPGPPLPRGGRGGAGGALLRLLHRHHLLQQVAPQELLLPALHDAAAPAGHLPPLRTGQEGEGEGEGTLPPRCFRFRFRFLPGGPSPAPPPPALGRLPAPGGARSPLDRFGRGTQQLELPLHHGLPLHHDQVLGRPLHPLLLAGLQAGRAAQVLVVVLIAGGLFLFTYKAVQFNGEGFALVLGASFLGGIRWTLTQILLQKDELGLQNPIDTMFHLQPAMFLGLFPLFAVIEGLPLSTSEKLFRFHEAGLLLALLAKLALGGILAFGLGFSEFLLVSKTSSLALSISGIFKEVCTLLLATHLMGDHLSLLNWLGFVVCLLGITLHVALRVRGQKGPKPPKEPDLELLLLPHQDGEEVLEEAPLQR